MKIFVATFSVVLWPFLALSTFGQNSSDGIPPEVEKIDIDKVKPAVVLDDQMIDVYGNIFTTDFLFPEGFSKTRKLKIGGTIEIGYEIVVPIADSKRLTKTFWIKVRELKVSGSEEFEQTGRLAKGKKIPFDRLPVTAFPRWTPNTTYYVRELVEEIASLPMQKWRRAEGKERKTGTFSCVPRPNPQIDDELTDELLKLIGN